MKNARKCIVSGGMLFTGALCALLGGAGCQDRPHVRRAPSTMDLPQRSLEDLKQSLLAEAASFQTLTADCRVALTSPRRIRRPEVLDASGRLALEKPGKIYLNASRVGETYIKLIGDGRRYEVRMPVLEGMRYGGAYGDALQSVPNRVHFMPDDLADALDLTRVMRGEFHTLRAYPPRGDLVSGDSLERAVFGSVYVIDSIVAAGGSATPSKVRNSLVIDRVTEQPLRLDKFRIDGSLRVRISYLDLMVVEGGGRSARVPSELLIWYPSPLENTVIRLRLTKVKVNVPIQQNVFELRG